jgi:lipid-A-disaccharide synthase
MPGLTPYPGTVRHGGLRVGLIAGEPSGDLLGAGLVREIRRYYPDATFCGIAGPAMLAEGVTSWVPMERLSVMGIVEVLRHLPELLQIRRRVTRGFRTCVRTSSSASIPRTSRSASSGACARRVSARCIT